MYSERSKKTSRATAAGASIQLRSLAHGLRCTLSGTRAIDGKPGRIAEGCANIDDRASDIASQIEANT